MNIGAEDLQEIKEYIEDLVDALVNHPEDVHVSVVPKANKVVAELHTHPDDVGIVIGMRGKTISAIRSIIGCLGGRKKVWIELYYVTEEENARRRAAAGGVR